MDTIAPTHQTSGKEGVEASYVDNVGETTGDKDKIAQEAVGGRISDLPPGYYRSMHFIGTFLVSTAHTSHHTYISDESYTGSLPGKHFGLPGLGLACQCFDHHQ